MSIKFGLFTDLHYALPDMPARDNNRRSLEDMRKGMTRFAQAGVDFVVTLGDNIQTAGDISGEYNLLKFLMKEWNSYGVPVHVVWGNHDFSQLSYAHVLEAVQTDRSYYSFDLKGCRFIILDTNYDPDDRHFGENQFDWKLAKLSEEEVIWLEEKLADRKRTIIFTHANLYFDPAQEISKYYQILNRGRIWDILEKAGCVEVVFQGHFHEYRYFQSRKIHFINVPSPTKVEAYDPACFPIVEIREDGFVYNGNLFNSKKAWGLSCPIIQSELTGRI